MTHPSPVSARRPRADLIDLRRRRRLSMQTAFGERRSRPFRDMAALEPKLVERPAHGPVDIIPMLKHTLENMTFAAAAVQAFRDPATSNADDRRSDAIDV